MKEKSTAPAPTEPTAAEDGTFQQWAEFILDPTQRKFALLGWNEAKRRCLDDVGAQAKIDAEHYAALRTRVEALQAVVEAAKVLAQCQTTFQSYPTGWTCLDMQRNAEERPDGYMPAYRKRLVSGSELCDHCRLRAALARLEGAV